MRKYHFEHQLIDAKAVVKTFQDEVFPHCLKHGYKLIILDNDSKSHTKALVEVAAEEGLSWKRQTMLGISDVDDFICVRIGLMDKI